MADTLVAELRARDHEAELVTDSVQVVSGDARPRPGVPLAPARPDRVRRAADRPRARDEVPLVRRPASEQARLGAAPVPAGVRARPNRSGPVLRRTPRPGVAALGPNPGPDRARRGEAALRHLAQRRRADRALHRSRGRGAAAPAAGAALPQRRLRRLRPLGRPARPGEAERPPARGGGARPRPARCDRRRRPGPRPARGARRRARPERARRVPRPRRRGRARVPLRRLPGRLLRAGRRGLRDGPLRGVPLREAGADDDGCRRPARGRHGRPHRLRHRARSGRARRAPRDACASTRTRREPTGGRARSSPHAVTWDACIETLLS